MPKSRNASKRKPRARRSTKRRSYTSRSSRTVMAIHRRMVLFPKVTDSTWLEKLSWFASVALKLFALVTGVTDDLKATSANVGSGSVIILGPGDFAAFAPVAVPVSTTRSDNEVKCLKAFPYERASLRKVTIRIVPSVDIGERGGMYAACLIPIDSVDSTVVGNSNPALVKQRYSANYDDIIKNPRAKMSPVNRALTLSLRLSGRPSNIRIHWDSTEGYVNTYPSCALLVAFSDLAAKEASINSNYSPNKSLFEVHMTGDVEFSEPSEVTVQHDNADASLSCYTPKLSATESKNINVKFFDHQFETPDGIVDLRKINYKIAEQMVRHYGREDLIPKLRAECCPEMDFERLEV